MSIPGIDGPLQCSSAASGEDLPEGWRSLDDQLGETQGTEYVRDMSEACSAGLSTAVQRVARPQLPRQRCDRGVVRGTMAPTGRRQEQRECHDAEVDM